MKLFLFIFSDNVSHFELSDSMGRLNCRHSVDGYYTPPARPLKVRRIFQKVKHFDGFIFHLFLSNYFYDLSVLFNIRLVI